MSDKIVTVRGGDVTVSVMREGSIYYVRTGERTDQIEVIAARNGEAELRVNGARRIVPFIVDGSSVQFMLDGETYRVEVSAKGQRRRGRHREHSMSAPMPAAVLKISVNVGDVVTRGTPLVILEAMKMEHQITAPYDGTVQAIHCSVGELVQPGVDLVSIEAKEALSS